MSDSKKFNEINEQELEQAAGGGGEKQSRVFYCPICGNQETVYFEGNPSRQAVLCRACQLGGRGDVRMNPEG